MDLLHLEYKNIFFYPTHFSTPNGVEKYYLLTTLPHFELGYATSIYIKNGFTPFGVQKFLNLVWGTKTLFLNPIWSTKRF